MQQHHGRTLATTPLQDHENDNILPLKPVGWIFQTLSLQFSAIASSISSFLSMTHESLHRAEEAKRSTEQTLYAVPAQASLALRKLGFGFLGAVYVCLILIGVMLVAILLGVGLVRMWVEEPMFVREPLHFDYTEAHPSAALFLRGIHGRKKTSRAVPVGHTFYISVVLVLPESDFNRQVGVFQLTAEVISATGDIIATSSQPCMLRFRSVPVRLMRTFIMGVPLLMGILDEAQEIRVEILKYKEGYPKTEAIRVRLKPKAGTTALPELYSAEIIMNSQLPWKKELVRKWKWTFYVWSSLYMYIMLLIILVCCCKPIIFPMASIGDDDQRDQSTKAVKDQQSSLGGDGAVSDEFSDALRKWHRSRSKRKALTIRTRDFPDSVGSSASSITRDKTGDGSGETGESAAPESKYESC